MSCFSIFFQLFVRSSVVDNYLLFSLLLIVSNASWKFKIIYMIVITNNDSPLVTMILKLSTTCTNRSKMEIKSAVLKFLSFISADPVAF